MSPGWETVSMIYMYIYGHIYLNIYVYIMYTVYPSSSRINMEDDHKMICIIHLI